VRCLVTGCAGFIGSHLADHLLELGHEVRGVDSLVRGGAYVNPGVLFRKADIRSAVAARLMAGADWVFHTAAVSTTPHAVRDPVTCNAVNVDGTLALLEAAREHGVKRFVFSSSNIVYAAPTAYKVSKLAAEGYCEAYAHLYGVPTVSLRYSNVFGSLRQNPENVIASMRASALERGFIVVTGDGEQTRDFTNVADICRASVLAAQSDTGGWMDICTGISLAMNAVAAMFGVPVKHVPDRPGDIKHIVQDPRPASVLLGFEARVPFKTGMEPYLA
jgi:nucleoside-diphosphate-sugar epimerase